MTWTRFSSFETFYFFSSFGSILSFVWVLSFIHTFISHHFYIYILYLSVFVSNDEDTQRELDCIGACFFCFLFLLWHRFFLLCAWALSYTQTFIYFLFFVIPHLFTLFFLRYSSFIHSFLSSLFLSICIWEHLLQ